MRSLWCWEAKQQTTTTADLLHERSMMSQKHHRKEEKNILILNIGSSSIKFHLYLNDQRLSLLLNGIIDRIGEEHSTRIKLVTSASSEKQEWKERQVDSHSAALDKILQIIQQQSGANKDNSSESNIHNVNLLFVGHRVVHGGLHFHQQNSAFLVDDQVLKDIEQVSELAPLHNPVNLRGITECMKTFKDIPQVVAFDTSFHHTIPPVAFHYALPKDRMDPQVRKYGFHGLSHDYVYGETVKYFRENFTSEWSSEREKDLKVITLHLGNGCSACAIQGGKSMDTSMGMTPLQGLIMGTRTGDIDPAVVFYQLRKEQDHISQTKVEAVEKMLNSKSGLKGICGVNDMRTVIEHMKNGDQNAKLAFEMFCYRIRQYIGSYFVTLGGCDALVFTAGIGENSSDIRTQVCQGLECIGIHLDDELNQRTEGVIRQISANSSRVKVLVVPTDEEKHIALLGLQLFSDR